MCFFSRFGKKPVEPSFRVNNVTSTLVTRQAYEAAGGFEGHYPEIAAQIAAQEAKEAEASARANAAREKYYADIEAQKAYWR